MNMLARGRCANGKWVYGVLLTMPNTSTSKILVWCKSYMNGNDGQQEFDCYDVDPDTIGWYTGWDDKNGTKIFTGDKVSLINEDGECIVIIAALGKVERQINDYTVEINGFYFILPDGRKCFPIVNNYIGKHDTELYEVVGTIFE